jgi:alanine-synthesizing transaminase
VLSRRTGWDRTANRLSMLVARLRAEGTRVLDLTLTNPTQAGLGPPPDVLAGLAASEGLRYEPDPFGLYAAREAVAADYVRRGVAVSPERVLLTASTSEAYGCLFKLLCDPGDEVLVPRPSYPLFDYLAGLESVTTAAYPLVYAGEWHLDLEGLAQAVGPRTRAVVVVSPHNPTGSFLKDEEAGAVLALAARHGLAVIADEVFTDYAWRPDVRRAPSLAADGPALAFSLGGLSKACGLPQLKLAWTVLSGPEEQVGEARARLEIVADTYLSVSTPVQVALPELLRRRAELAAPIAARVEQNRRALGQRLQTDGPATLLDGEGGWAAVLRVPATVAEEELVTTLLEREHVLVQPGYFFDFPGEGYLVLSLLTPPPDLAEGMKRLLRVL